MTSGDEIESRVRQAIVDLGVEATFLPCDPDFADTAAFCERYGVNPEDSANTIIVAATRGERRFAACLALATTRLDVNGLVRRHLDFARASFATAEDTLALTGMLIGGVTAVALPPEMKLLIDSSVMTRPSIVIGGGSRSLKLQLAPAALLRLPNAEVVENLAAPRPQ